MSPIPKEQNTLAKLNMDEELEEIHFKRVLRAFATFNSRMQRKLLKHFDDWNRLPQIDREIIIPEYKRKLEKISDTFEVNQEFFDEVVSFTTTGMEPFEGSLTIKDDSYANTEDLRIKPTDRDYENLRSTLRQLVREWSEEGSQERADCFSPILDHIGKLYKSRSERAGVRVLVPGAGLGRLAWEINRLGFNVQGNEFSLYMLLTSQLILNNAHRVGQFAVHPFAFPLSNHLSEADSLRVIWIPDVTADTGSEECGRDFSMTAGDFVEIYSREEEQEAWDCVVTCFFLDTAQNVLEYLRVIHGILKPNGVWINLGPLQYHFESAPEMSIELTWEEVILSSERIGFKFTEKRLLNGLNLPYAQDQRSLSRTMYKAVFSAALAIK